MGKGVSKIYRNPRYFDPLRVWTPSSHLSWKLWKIQDKYDVKGRLDSIVRSIPISSRRRNHLEFFKIFKLKVTTVVIDWSTDATSWMLKSNFKFVQMWIRIARGCFSIVIGKLLRQRQGHNEGPYQAYGRLHVPGQQRIVSVLVMSAKIANWTRSGVDANLSNWLPWPTKSRVHCGPRARGPVPPASRAEGARGRGHGSTSVGPTMDSHEIFFLICPGRTNKERFFSFQLYR